MPTLTPQSQAVINAFAQQSGVTPDHVRNLQQALQDSPALTDQFNDAVAQDHLRKIVPLSHRHAGGEYDGQNKAMCLPLGPLTTKPGTGTFNVGEMTFVLGHELQHGVEHAAKMRALGDFYDEVKQVARSPSATHDYTAATGKRIAAHRNDEASAERFGTMVVKDRPYRGNAPRFLPMAIVSSCLMLAACAHAQPEPVSLAHQDSTMTTHTTTAQDGDARVHPRLTAEQALLRLLELIRTSKTIAEFTPERLGQVMEVPIVWANNGADRYGFGESLTPQWDIGFGVNRAYVTVKERPRFELFFNPNPSGISPPMTDICQVDFDRFTAELEAMGFTRGSYYDPLSHTSPARLMYDYFERSGMRIEVTPRGETDEKANHDCVKMLFIY